ncbi:2-dehydro-3-deoxygalactonokinase [Porticoccaceae bacterium]|nr:2-dehydro-3-deoxygalactonokinase [Porticoccaceae bacterium]MDA8936825.1 2-dehydro-3-deoxygalactonokinase [Porticoccaceae bacterium]
MAESVFIAGDWGSTHLRLYLCCLNSIEITSGPASETAEILAIRNGPGCSKIDNDFEQIFFDLVADWIEQYGPVPVILSGAVGSNIGWHTVPYLDCPAGPDQIARATTKLHVRGLDLWILSGLKTLNALQTPDIMRGEELQLLGWMLTQSKQASEQIVMLPGTHNKWALVKDGQVDSFVTAFTGELYSLLEQQSMLITQPMAENFSDKFFMQGVELAKTLQPGQLLNALFGTRSRQIAAELTAEDAASYLSGLLVASDIIGSMALLNLGAQITQVVIIGNQMLSYAYQLALSSLGIAAKICDPAQIAVAGYKAVYQSLDRDRDQ